MGSGVGAIQGGFLLWAMLVFYLVGDNCSRRSLSRSTGYEPSGTAEHCFITSRRTQWKSQSTCLAIAGFRTLPGTASAFVHLFARFIVEEVAESCRLQSAELVASAYTPAHSIGFCVIWVCISSSSSSRAAGIDM